MSVSTVNGPIADARVKTAMVLFSGSTALSEGQGVCYNWDYIESGVAVTAFSGKRSNVVEVPTILNARYFAGVASRAYAAKTGGQFIEIYLPGSWCNVLCRADTVIGVGFLTCEAGGTYAGYFRYEGFEGEGSCVPLQTVTNAASAGNCFVRLQEGLPSGLVESVSIATAGGVIVCMVGGVTIFPANTLTDANATFDLADSVINGQRKGFVTTGTQATNNIVISPASAQQNKDASTSLATWTTDTALEELFLTWHGFGTNGAWREDFHIGGTVA